MHVVAVAEVPQTRALEGRVDPSLRSQPRCADDNAEVAPREVVWLDLPTAEISSRRQRPIRRYARVAFMLDLTGSTSELPAHRSRPSASGGRLRGVDIVCPPARLQKVLTSAAAERSGTVVRAGAQIRYELFGSGEQAVFLLPTWSIVHTDFWRHQVPHLADRYTVLTFDGLGNGASDRPTDPAYYSDDAFVDDAVKVLDAAGIDEAALVSVSMAAGWQLLLAHRFPERVAACVYVSTDLPLARLPPGYAEAEESFDQHLYDPVGWQMWNRRFWHQDWEAFCRFFFSRCFTDPDSEQEIEHFVSMGLETTPDVIAATVDAVGISEQQAREAAAAVTAPTLILHGEKDAISSVDASRELARLTSGDLVVLPEAGHEPQCRYPHTVNRMLDAFLARVWGSPH